MDEEKRLNNNLTHHHHRFRVVSPNNISPTDILVDENLFDFCKIWKETCRLLNKGFVVGQLSVGLMFFDRKTVNRHHHLISAWLNSCRSRVGMFQLIFHRRFNQSLRLQHSKGSQDKAVGRITKPGNTKEGSITVLLTSCLTGLESAVWQLIIFVFICKTD